MWFFLEGAAEAPSSADRVFSFGGVPPAPFSLTRTVSALGRDISGRWVPFPANVARTWYHPITQDKPYTLIEPERTQLLYRTRQPTLTTVQSSSTVDATVQTPFGLGSVLFVPNTTSATHGWNLFFGLSSHGTNLADNSTVAVTAVMKPFGIYTNVTFFLLKKTNVYASVRVSLEANGSVVSSDGVVGADVRRDTDGFYTIVIINNYGSGTATPSFNAGFHDPTGTRTFSGDGVSGFHLAYIGAEIGLEATSPIVNEGQSPVIRSADILTSGAEWLETGSKSLGLTYIPLSAGTATIFSAFGADSIDLSNTASAVSLTAQAGGQQVVSIGGPSPPNGTERSVVFTLSPGSALLAQNGAVLGGDNTGAALPNALSSVRLGAHVSGTSGGPMLLSLIKYWSESMPQDTAVAYSGDLTQNFETGQKLSVTVQPTMTVPASADAVSLLVSVIGEPTGTVVTYNMISDTALSGADYIGTSGTLVIPAGQTAGVITIGLMPRGEDADKKFKIQLTSASGATILNGLCEVLLLRKLPDYFQASTKIEFGETLPPDLSLTRSSPAWTRGSDGIWVQVGQNAYRRHFVSSGMSGLLIEPAVAEQRLFDSVDPSFVATSGTREIVTSQVTPTGSRLIRFREAASTAVHKLTATLNTANSDMPTGSFTVSLIIRPINRSFAVLFVRGMDSIVHGMDLSLTGEGAVTAVTSGGGTVTHSVERDPFRPDWYSVSLTRPQSIPSGVDPVIEIVSATGTGVTSIAGSVDSGFDICHIQLEPGILASSPIVVSAASAKTVRAADILKASGTWHQRQSYSLGVRFRRLRDAPETQRLWMAKDVSGGINGVTIKGGEISFDVAGDAPRLTFEAAANGTQTVWQLPNPETDGNPYRLIVSVDGVLQSTLAYTLENNVLTISQPPPAGAVIDVRAIGHTVTLIESAGTGSQTIWGLPANQTGTSGALLVSVDGAVQSPSSYDVLSAQVSFKQAPPPNSVISVRTLNPATVTQQLSGNGIQTSFTILFAAQGASSLIIAVDGSVQPPSSYTADSTQVVFSGAPPSGSVIDVRYIGL